MSRQPKNRPVHLSEFLQKDGPPPPSSYSPKKIDEPCTFFFKRGGCKKGKDCPYSHASPPQDDTRDDDMKRGEREREDPRRDESGPQRRDDYQPRRDTYSSQRRDDFPPSHRRDTYQHQGDEEYPPQRRRDFQSQRRDDIPYSADKRDLPSRRDEYQSSSQGRGGAGRREESSYSRQERQPPTSSLSTNTTTYRGRVERIRDTHGTIVPQKGGKPIYFHVNEVQGFIPREGDEVEYCLQEERTGVSAIRVRSLGAVSILSPQKREEKKETMATPTLTTTGTTASTSMPMFAPAWMMKSSSAPSQQPVLHKEESFSKEETTSIGKRAMLDWLKGIEEGDPEALLLQIDKLSATLNNEELPFTVIQPIVNLLARPEIRNSERTDRIYQTVMESKFLFNPRNLRSYIIKSAAIKNPTVDDNNHLMSCLFLLEELIDRCQTYRDLPIDALEALSTSAFQPNIGKSIQKLIQRKTEMRMQTSASMLDASWSPEEEDFRDIPIFPTTEEILGIKSGEFNPHLRANIVEGKFTNVMHYLDTHFRLLREDCLQPLREGIQAYRANKLNARDMRVYTDVKVVGMQCSRSGLVYRVSFQIENEVDWTKSKRLIYGSLLCISPDKFDTLLWATVAQRDSNLLEAQQQIDIRFPSGYEPRFLLHQTYTMVESSTTYFEAYQHVLRALQQLDLEKFPFSDYLISCQANVVPPHYLKSASNADKYNLSSVLGGEKTMFSILQNWPEVTTSMDASQLNAFKQALTKEFAIIQGPPGTGKTFVGLKVMQALLTNAQGGRRPSPILVVCYTNHALDQFLEGIMEFEENVVRIGSRSRSEKLKERNVRALMYNTPKPGQQHRSRKIILQQLEQIQKEIEICMTDMNNLSLSIIELRKVATEEQVESLLNQSPQKKIKGGKKMATQQEGDVVKQWLTKDPKVFLTTRPNTGLYNASTRKRPTMSSAAPSTPEAEDEVEEEMLERLQADRMVGEDESGESKVIDLPFFGGETPSLKLRECKNVWDLSIEDRASLYRYWAEQIFEMRSEPLLALTSQYEKLCKECRYVDDALKVEILANAAVIGMTTTGVAKFHSIVQAVQPEIIIVEEAAEVLEAHIVVALCQNTKHVILIGDHEQLRPSTAVYQLSTKFHLDVSLFERMVRNNVEQVTLLRQRRMRPEVSCLISPLYPKLEDHNDVKKYPRVMGVAKDVFFLNHSVEEDKRDEDSNSKSNSHEATFLTHLCRYLLLQGYQPEQITVLTPYSGQVRLLNKSFRHHSVNGVRVTSIDNFQGEESDIILLSLVRSNPNGEMGFLNITNRVCVALSRAKQGMFIIGNGEMLRKKNQLWRSVIEILDKEERYGDKLQLTCQVHPNKFTHVQNEADFANVTDGGCDKPCKAAMACGHICPRLCHPYPHSQLLCQAQCHRLHPGCGHDCKKRCCEDCGPCLTMVDKDLPCGHTVKAHCCEDRGDVKCTFACEKRLPCRHPCAKLCGERCTTNCQVLVERELPCNHTKMIPCFTEMRKYKCNEPCLEYLPCRHKCIGNCYDCSHSKLESKHVVCAECGV